MAKIKGTVKFFDDNGGYGFIEREDGGDDVYYNEGSCESEVPGNGDNVEFETVTTGRGPKAVNLQIIEDENTEFLKENVLDLEKADYDKFCDTVKKYANDLKKNELTTSQIRKVYSRIMNTENPRDLKRLRPQFAYTAGREDEKGVKDFMDLLDYLTREMDEDNEKELENFKTFMEAAVAYRKYAGGDE